MRSETDAPTSATCTGAAGGVVSASDAWAALDLHAWQSLADRLPSVCALRCVRSGGHVSVHLALPGGTAVVLVDAATGERAVQIIAAPLRRLGVARLALRYATVAPWHSVAALGDRAESFRLLAQLTRSVWLPPRPEARAAVWRWLRFAADVIRVTAASPALAEGVGGPERRVEGLLESDDRGKIRPHPAGEDVQHGHVT